MILFLALCKRNYSKRWLGSITSKSVRQLQIVLSRIAESNATTSCCSWNPCSNGKCKTCEMVALQPTSYTFISACIAINNMLEKLGQNSEYGIMRTDILYALESLPSSAFFTHREKLLKISRRLPLLSMEGDYFIILIEQLSTTGWYAQDQLARLSRLWL